MATLTDTPPLQKVAATTVRTPLQDMLRRIARHRSAQVGAAILGLMIIVAVFAPVLAPFDPIRVLKDVKPRVAPCIHLLGCPADQSQHIMGVDGNRRDLFSRIIYGARLSLVIGVATVSFAIVIGAALGAVAAYLGGWIDNTIMRLMDILLAFPSLLLAIAIVAALGPGLWNALLAVAFVSIPVYARIVRATGGPPAVTDGPFPEAKEFLAGYWIVEVPTAERAYEIAAKASAAPGRGGKPLNMPIEVRQVMSAPPV